MPSASPPVPRTEAWTGLRPEGRPLLATAIALGVAAAAGLVYSFDPASPRSLFPPCVFHLLTGLECPGCGLTRAVHALLHGEARRALELNALLPLYASLLVPGGIGEIIRIGSGQRPRALYVRYSFVAASAVAIVAFGILRNLA